MEVNELFGRLVKVNDKEEAMQIIKHAYNYKNTKKFPEEILKHHSQSLVMDIREMAKLLRYLGEFSDQAAYNCWKTSEEVGISSDSSEGKLLAMALEEWHNLALYAKVANPKLLSFSTEVCPRPLPRFTSDQQSDSNQGGSSNDTVGGICLINLKIRENQNKVSKTGNVCDMTLELPKNILDDLINGLSHVRSQLSSVTTKNS